MLITSSQAILERLAKDGRRILSDWRAFIYLRRATVETAEANRRWEKPPADFYGVRPILKKMVEAGVINRLDEAQDLYEVSSLYAANLPSNDYELLLEFNPYCVLAYYSAFEFHQMTTSFPQEIHAWGLTGADSGNVPLGTTADEWEETRWPRGLKVPSIGGRTIEWHRILPKYRFAWGEFTRLSVPVRVTTRERTLIDGLLHPHWCGGLTSVLAAWKENIEKLSIDSIAETVDRFDMTLLKQRVGFIFDKLNVKHSALSRWAKIAQRGGSAKLAADQPFVRHFDERWCLSINVDTSSLERDGK